MEPEHEHLLSVFFPQLLDRLKTVVDNDFKFVQYTNADAAMKILQSEEVWLRNIRCMNDYSEVEHGIRCIVEAVKDKTLGGKFNLLLENIQPGFSQEFIGRFNSWLPHFRANTYIACVSEHPKEEDKYGRLSMWRAYGSNNPVALVMNNLAFRAETNAFEAYTYPVLYLDNKGFKDEFASMLNRLQENIDFIKGLSLEQVDRYLFFVLKVYALCVKHPGFNEEREWRIVYTPTMASSDRVLSSIESIQGVPQMVHKIPLANIPEENFHGATISELIHKVIIGPCEHSLILHTAFMHLLADAGCEQSEKLVHISNVPLR